MRALFALSCVIAVGCSSTSTTPTRDASVVDDGGVPTDAGIADRAAPASDAGLPGVCPDPALDFCDDFQSGALSGEWTTGTIGSGLLKVTGADDAKAPLALAVRGVGGSASVRHTLVPTKLATLVFFARVETMVAEATLVRLDLRAGAHEDVVLGPFPNTNRVAVYLDHIPDAGEKVRTEVANFPLDRYARFDLTLPAAGGAVQPLHVLVNGDIRAYSLPNPDPSPTPGFTLGATANTGDAVLWVDNVMLTNR